MKRQLSDGDASPSSKGSINHVDLCVLCLTGEGVTLKVHHSTLGREVQQMVSDQLPGKPGTKFVLYCMESRLRMHQTLQEQGILGAATLSGARIATNLYRAWCLIQEIETSEADEDALNGVTCLDQVPPGKYLGNLPQTLQSLTLCDNFNQSLECVTWPS